MCLSEVIPSVQRLVNRCDFSKKKMIYIPAYLYMYQETYYFSFNAIGIPFPVKKYRRTYIWYK